MKRRGWLLALVIVATLAMAESVWAGKCLNGCYSRCAYRSGCYTVAPWGCCGMSLYGGCCGAPMYGSCCGTPVYRGCCGTSIYGSYWDLGWNVAGSWSGSCGCGATVSGESISTIEPTPEVPAAPEEPRLAPAAAPAEPTLPPPPAHTVRPTEKPSEMTAPKMPAPQPAAPPVPSPVKPANPKKAEAPAKKVAWSGHGLRVWTDSTGNHQVTARFVATLDEGAVVRLLRADGSFVRITFSDLSAEDQEYVLGQTTKVASTW